MFMVLSTYRAKVGEEDAIIALYENWHLDQDTKKMKAYLWWALLRKADDPYGFIDIAHFENEEAAQTMRHDLDQDAWYPRLLSLMEDTPVYTCCNWEWQPS